MKRSTRSLISGFKKENRINQVYGVSRSDRAKRLNSFKSSIGSSKLRSVLKNRS